MLQAESFLTDQYGKTKMSSAPEDGQAIDQSARKSIACLLETWNLFTKGLNYTGTGTLQLDIPSIDGGMEHKDI